MNLRELFNEHHNGFDNFGAWYEHHKAMYAKHPLECEEFGAEWLRRWEAVGRLFMQQIACVEVFCPPCNEWYAADFDPSLTAGSAIIAVLPAIPKKRRQIRIVLLDGAIVKEWGGT